MFVEKVLKRYDKVAMYIAIFYNIEQTHGR